MIAYTAEHLYCIRDSRPTHFNQDAWKSACKASVATCQPTQRGCRGGARKQRVIQVIVCGRSMTPARSRDQINRGRHLKTIALCTTPTPYLKVMLQNTRSICNKVSVVAETIIDADADVSFLTETWLRSDHQDIVNDLTLPGFELKHLNRLGKRGGGLCVLHRNSLKFVRTAAVTPTHFELLQLSCSKPCYHFALIYKPPASSVPGFLDEFEDLVSSLVTTTGRLLILGDFNLHLDDPTSPGVTRLNNILQSTGLVQHMTQPTHKSNHTLDIVISRIDDTMLTSSVVALPNTFSDHHTITFSIKGFTPRPTTHKRRGRDYRRIDLNNFQADLHSELSSCIACDGESVDTIVQKYSDSVFSTLDSHAPIVTRNRRSKTSQPWLDDSILDMRRKRRALERKWRHTGLEIDKQIYTSQIDSVKLHIREAKCSYYNAALNNADTKATFQVLNALTKPNEQKLPAHENDNSMCVAFAEFFDEKVNRIIDFTRTRVTAEYVVLPLLPPCPPVRSPFNDLGPTDKGELQKIIEARPSKCCSLDVLPTWLVKATLPVNASLLNGEFPQAFKIASVTPLLKKASLDQNDLNNYRPISNLAFIGKVIEKVVLKRLNLHMTENNLHDRMQSAYREQHSTETALMKVQHDIVHNLDSGHCVMLVLLDTSAAFDTINIDLLLNTLHQRFGIGGRAFDWFKSYLTGRSQRVAIGSSSSTTTPVYHGVPQGSVLGPVMFNVYTTPIADICKKHQVHYHRFADDIQLYVSYNPAESEELNYAKLQLIQCIDEIRAWMLLHQLKLNDNKTEFMVLQSSHNLRVHGSPTLQLSQLTLTSTDTARNLGCFFDRHMQLDRLVSSYCSSAYYHLRTISNIRHLLTLDACHAAVRSLVLSRLDYCNALLGGLNNRQLDRLQRAQNSAARVVYRVRQRDHITPTLRTLHWLPIRMRISFKICTYMFKAIHGLGPEYINCVVERYMPVRALRSSCNGILLKVTVPRKTIGQSSFTVTGPQMWNDLPIDVRSAQSLTAFRKRLKTCLFRRHYLA